MKYNEEEGMRSTFRNMGVRYDWTGECERRRENRTIELLMEGARQGIEIDIAID